MAVITFTTDFGIKDEYAGVMKGAVLTVNPHVTLVDISHHIPPFDVMAAARMLDASFAFFPEKTVHVTVVDPGVGSPRRIVAFEMENHLFLAPDNGIPAHLIRGRTVSRMVRLSIKSLTDRPISTTFHGRDLFAPAAARLAGGLPLACLGPPVDPAGLVIANGSEPRVDSAGRVYGQITSIDRFGNLITDLDRPTLTSLLGPFKDGFLEADLGRDRVRGLFDHYAQVSPSRPLMVIGSRGYLEIAVNGGSARDRFKVSRGDGVTVVISGETPHSNIKEGD